MKENKNEINLGDILLGYDKKNGKPITIPYADRYLHTLIVGSDRENKLKNTLIPMINQDLKNHDLGVTIIEPGEDLMKEAIKTCETINRDVITINPLKPNGIIINPLIGEESDVVEIFSSTFKIMNMNLSDTYYLPCDDLLRRAIILIKRLKGDNATLTDIDLLLNNPNNCGRKMITDFIKIEDSNREKAKENERIARWFLNDYYSGMNGERGATNTFELCRALRLQMSTFTNNEYVKNIMLPSEDSSSTILDFNKTLKGKTVVAISSQQQKLGNVGKHMGYLITECFQSAIFRRPGSDATRIPNMVYINQFEQFATPALGNVLTMGRGYRVSLNLVVDSRDCMIPGETINPGSINGFKSVIDANTRNKIIYPSSYEDAVYYQNHFVSIFNFYKNEKNNFKDKLSNIFKDNYKEDDFMTKSILNREYATFTATLIKNNSIQSPVIVTTKK